LPWREGSAIDLDGFSESDEEGVLFQRARWHGGTVERRFRIDTLEPNFASIESTAVSAEGAAWLDAERDTLCAAKRP
jgi:hypothetical protein